MISFMFTIVTVLRALACLRTGKNRSVHQLTRFSTVNTVGCLKFSLLFSQNSVKFALKLYFNEQPEIIQP